MKRHILAGISMVALAAALQPAAAADLPVAYRAPQNYVIFTWTGFYFGAHGGGGWGRKDAAIAPLRVRRSARRSARNQCRHQRRPRRRPDRRQLPGRLLGLRRRGRRQLGGSHRQHRMRRPASSGSRRTAARRSTRSAPSPAGSASRSTASCSTARAAPPSPTTSTNSTRSPRTEPTRPAGAGWWARGIEYSFTDNWSAKIEYNYLDFGTRAVRFTDTTGLFALDTSIRERIHVAKVGINYRFGWAPVGVTY